jgi:hypothetical protein
MVKWDTTLAQPRALLSPPRNPSRPIGLLAMTTAKREAQAKVIRMILPEKIAQKVG